MNKRPRAHRIRAEMLFVVENCRGVTRNGGSKYYKKKLMFQKMNFKANLTLKICKWKSEREVKVAGGGYKRLGCGSSE